MNVKLQGKGNESSKDLLKNRNICKETCSECLWNKSSAAVNSFSPRWDIVSQLEAFQRPIFGSLYITPNPSKKKKKAKAV